MSPGARRRRLAAGLAPALALAACFSSAGLDYPARPGPHDRLVGVLPAEVAEVQRLRAEGELETARAFVARLCERDPEHLPLARLRQDVELELGGEAAREALVAEERARVASEPRALWLLLAARLEQDPAEARRLLDRALAVRPESAWVHYALAHLEAREGHWARSTERLERGLLIDPGHLWARRLETMLLARGGDRDDAIEALQRWLRAAEPSAFFSARELAEARMDLAQLYVLEDRPAQARATLEKVVAGQRESARAQLLLAAIAQAESEPERALLAARRASAADPSDPLALVQQAMIEEEWLGDPEEARRRWERVLEVSSARSDLPALLLGLRARAALERLEAARVELP